MSITLSWLNDTTKTRCLAECGQSVEELSECSVINVTLWALSTADQAEGRMLTEPMFSSWDRSQVGDAVYRCNLRKHTDATE